MGLIVAAFEGGEDGGSFFSLQIDDDGGFSLKVAV